jgi:hypothetical protein
MDVQAAKLVFAVIMAVGGCVWMISLRKALRLGLAPPLSEQTTFDVSNGGDTFAVESGTVTVPGDPPTLSRALVRSFHQSNLGLVTSLYKIRERRGERVTLKKTGPLMCNQPPNMYFSEAEISFAVRSQEGTQVSYTLGYARLARLLRKVSLGLILGVGLPVMLIVGGVVWYFVVSNQNPAVRWQVFQTFQIIHSLWPPFLVMYLYNVGRRQSKSYMENLIGSLEFLAD